MNRMNHSRTFSTYFKAIALLLLALSLPATAGDSSAMFNVEQSVSAGLGSYARGSFVDPNGYSRGSFVDPNGCTRGSFVDPNGHARSGPLNPERRSI